MANSSPLLNSTPIGVDDHSMATTNGQGGATRARLMRHPVAVECARAARSLGGDSAQVVVYEDGHVFAVSSTEPDRILHPRAMNPAEAALWSAPTGPTWSCVDSDAAAAVLDGNGTLVAALSISGVASELDSTGPLALARIIESLLLEDEDAEFHEEVLRAQRDTVIVMDPDMSFQWVSNGIGSLLGRTPCELIGRPATDLLHPDDVSTAIDALARMSQGLEMYRVVVRLSNDRGEFVPIEVTGNDATDRASVGGVVLSLRDAQQERELEIVIDRERRTSDAIVSGLRDGVVATDEFGAITAVNDAARSMFDIDPALSPAQLDASLFGLVDLDGRPHDIFDPANDPGAVCCLVSPRGDLIYLSTVCQPIADDTSSLGTVVILSDVTAEHRTAEELRNQALHDQLTGLANRRQLEQRLDDLCTSASQVDVAACLIDLDAFKGVNDTHGHRIGDQLIRLAASRLERELRPGDLLVRQGGDEFVALLVGIEGIEVATQVAERCREVLAEPYESDGTRFDLTASIGVSVSTAAELDADQLLQEADLALYAAKDGGRDRVETFDGALAAAAINEEFQRRLLREALDEGRLVMHFQPLVDTLTEQVVGFEALARLRDLDGAILGPATFMSGIERTSLMWDLDRAAFRLSCQAAALFHRVAPDRPPYVACNFSSVSVNHPGFIDLLEEVVADAGIDSSLISIELTESSAFDTGERGMAALAAAGRRGFRIALDDFGTGYSSLSHIRDLPISSIKVDRSFIVRLGEHTNERSITEAVVNLADNLGLGIVAEGVETAMQLEQARQLGFSTIQGWYYSRAVPLAECLERWVGVAVADGDAKGAATLPVDRSDG